MFKWLMACLNMLRLLFKLYSFLKRFPYTPEYIRRNLLVDTSFLPQTVIGHAPFHKPTASLWRTALNIFREPSAATPANPLWASRKSIVKVLETHCWHAQKLVKPPKGQNGGVVRKSCRFQKWLAGLAKENCLGDGKLFKGRKIFIFPHLSERLCGTLHVIACSFFVYLAFLVSFCFSSVSVKFFASISVICLFVPFSHIDGTVDLVGHSFLVWTYKSNNVVIPVK